jgi:endonuclease/exonuclease/phosphatase family metal-dependent hydrolase
MQTYAIAFWNLENLFAPEGFPGREPWIAKEVEKDLEGWTETLFARKIEQLATGIRNINGGAGPDLLGVCEVENRFVLDRLTQSLRHALPQRAYNVVHADSTLDKRGIDTAFLFDAHRLDTNPGEVFSHFVMRRTGTRDITQATFKTRSGLELIALANHWPSRSGGHHTASQGFRMTAGETLGYWHERIREVKGNDIAILAMGDFNDEPADPSLTVHANSSRERDDIENSTSARFYNLAWGYMRQAVTTKSGKPRTIYGSLYFKGDGNIFDQILVNRALLRTSGPFRVREQTARIEAFPAMVSDSKNDGPIRFGLPKGDPAKNVNPDGFSDHFPVSVIVEADEAAA